MTVLVGTARRDITPEPGIWMSGYAGRGAAESVLDPLELTALALELDGRAVVLITADLLGFDAACGETIGGELGLAPEALILAASHTHGGPAFVQRITTEAAHLDAGYRERVLEAAVLAGREALERRSAAVGWFGQGATTLGINRRGAEPPHGMEPNPAGFYDRTVSVLAFAAPGSTRPHTVLFSAACHPTTLGAQTMLSADWPGAARRAVEAAVAGCRALFVQGCCGNIRPRTIDLAEPRRFRPGTPADVQRIGWTCAHEVLRLLLDDRRPLDGPLVAGAAAASLPLVAQPTPDELRAAAAGEGARATWARALLAAHGERLPRAVDYRVTAWRFGESLALVGLPGEVVSELGAAARAGAGLPLLLAAYCNAMPCYIPTAKILREGGYEAGVGSNLYYGVPGVLAEESEPRILAAVERACGKLPAVIGP